MQISYNYNHMLTQHKFVLMKCFTITTTNSRMTIKINYKNFWNSQMIFELWIQVRYDLQRKSNDQEQDDIFYDLGTRWIILTFHWFCGFWISSWTAFAGLTHNHKVANKGGSYIFMRMSYGHIFNIYYV